MLFDFDPPDFARDGKDWPHRAASRFVRSNGIVWHVQEMGEGPAILLIHGTGGATHSWRDLMPLLSQRFRVIAPDLPGHGFTTATRQARMTLPAMADSLGYLMNAMEVKPVLVVGHSAGAAIAIRAALDGRIVPVGIVGLNAALMPFRGLAQVLFPMAARLLVLNPVVPRFFSWQADVHGVRRLIESTGSTISDDGVRFYQRLIAKSGHAAAALAMMANWELEPLMRDLPKLTTRLDLIVGQADSAVPPDDADRVKERRPATQVTRVPKLGHLAHEEDAPLFAALIARIADECALDTGAAPPPLPVGERSTPQASGEGFSTVDRAVAPSPGSLTLADLSPTGRGGGAPAEPMSCPPRQRPHVRLSPALHRPGRAGDPCGRLHRLFDVPLCRRSGRLHCRAGCDDEGPAGTGRIARPQ
jgi:magnesium chelatase accessory protein